MHLAINKTKKVEKCHVFEGIGVPEKNITNLHEQWV